MSDFDTSPIAFGGISALVSYPVGNNRRDTGVLLCRPWGRDEVCSRKFYKRLADKLAVAGFPTLRFDYPGNVDSLDPDVDEGFSKWIEAADKSAEVLKAISGCDRILLFGFGLGATVSHQLLQKRDDISGIVSAAPVTNGRRYIREMKLHAKLCFETEHIPLDRLDPNETSILGNVMPDDVVQELSGIKLDNCPDNLTNIPVLYFARETGKAQQDYGHLLQAASKHVTIHPFHEYDALTAQVLTSKVPEELTAATVAWISETQPKTQQAPRPIDPSLYPAKLETSSFSETSQYIEVSGKKLLTVVTSPKKPSRNASVFIFGNTGGYDHHGGLARDCVDQSRELAKHGVISIRYDGTNTGDSYPDFPEGQEVLYTDVPVRDFRSIVDFASARFEGPITLVGRCSSAYAAFHAAAEDERIRQLVLVNQLKLVWDPDVKVDLKYIGHRSGEEYRKRLKNPQSLKRLVSGNVDIPSALGGLTRLLKQRLSEQISLFLPKLTKFGRMKLEALGIFDALCERNVPVRLFCSLGDESINQLKAHFGPELEAFENYPNITYTTVEDSDHCLVPYHARKALNDFLIGISEQPAGCGVKGGKLVDDDGVFQPGLRRSDTVSGV